MLPATADKALGRAHEPRRGYHCLIYQVVSKCALRDKKGRDAPVARNAPRRLV